MHLRRSTAVRWSFCFGLAGTLVPLAAMRPAGAEVVVSATHDGLTVTIMAVPARPTAGQTMTFVVHAMSPHAPGALGYHLVYGDGKSAANAVPTFCAASPGPPATETWRLRHRYADPGTYRVAVTVRVNCTDERATAHSTVVVVSSATVAVTS